MSVDDDNAGEVEPGFVPRTELQRRILRETRKNPDLTAQQIADKLNCSKSYVCCVRGGGWKEYCRKSRREELTETERTILVARELYPQAPPRDLAYLAGCSTTYVYRTLGANEHLINADAEH